MITELVRRRRAQMLIHSYAYYVLDTPMVSDDAWQRWADELAALQRTNPWKIGFYDKVFADWDGSTGMHLPQDKWVQGKTRQILLLNARNDVAWTPPAQVAMGNFCQGNLF